MDQADRIKYLRIALLLVGLIFLLGIYPLTIHLAVWLVVARGPVGLPADDSGHLCVPSRPMLQTNVRSCGC